LLCPFLLRYFPLQRAVLILHKFSPQAPLGCHIEETVLHAIAVHKSIPYCYKSKILLSLSVLFGAGHHGHTINTFISLGSKKLKGCCLEITPFCEKYRNVKAIVTVSDVKTWVCKNWYYNERLNIVDVITTPYGSSLDNLPLPVCAVFWICCFCCSFSNSDILNL